MARNESSCMVLVVHCWEKPAKISSCKVKAVAMCAHIP